MTREAEIFGASLKRMREKKGLTQEGLAREAGITASYTSQLERGEKVVSLTVILKLARALEMTPSDLLTDFTMSSVKRLRFDE